MVKHPVKALSLALLFSASFITHAHANPILGTDVNTLGAALDSGEFNPNKTDSAGNTALHLAALNLKQYLNNVETINTAHANMRKESKLPMIFGGIGALVGVGFGSQIANMFVNNLLGREVSPIPSFGTLTPAGFLAGTVAGSLIGSTCKHLSLDHERLEKRAIPATILAIGLAAANYGFNTQHQHNPPNDARSLATLFGIGTASLLIMPEVVAQVGGKVKHILRDTFLAGTGIDHGVSCVTRWNAKRTLNAHIAMLEMLATHPTMNNETVNNAGKTAADIVCELAQTTDNADLRNSLLTVAHTIS